MAGICSAHRDTSEPDCPACQAPVDSLVISLDKFHYHEISDRCHLINSMIDDFVLDHPACNGKMTAWAEDAQRQLCNIMSMAAVEDEKLDKLQRLN